MSIFRSSSAFVGRGAELAALRAAYQDEIGRTVLISGDAGIGKSRLVHEFTTRLGSGPRVLTGRCLEFGNDGLPFAPFLSPLRSLAISSPGDWGAVLLAIERSADDRPLVLVLEDLHWADVSSLQLLTFLVANLAHDGVFLIGTCRAPSGPLRQLVAELVRSPAVQLITPAPLSRHETGRQLAALLAREPEPTLVTRVFERSRGNPLFVEALSACPEDIPAELRELLLAGLPPLADDEIQVLTLASIAGTTVGHEVLAVVSDLPEPKLHQALRRLVDKHVLLATGTGYAFRHALVREAVYHRLLPVERTGLHARFVAALSGMPEHVAQVAAHAYAAGDHTRALQAAWEAATQAALTGAEPERLHLLERVLHLWEEVGDTAGIDRLTVLDHAVEASIAVNAVSSGLRWSAEALAIAPDPQRYYRQARLKNLGRSGGRDDLLRALELLAEPSRLRGEVLAELALISVFAGEAEQGERYARAALDLAEQLDCPSLTARAHAFLGLAAASDPVTAFRHFAGAHATADPQAMIDIATWESALHVAMGAYTTAIEVIQLGIKQAQETFQYAKHAPILVVKWVQALTALGRWPEALDLIDEMLGEPELPQLSHAALLISQGEIRLAQGEPADARAAADRAEHLLGDEPWVRPYRIRLATLRIRLDPGNAQDIYLAAAPDLAAHPHEAWALVAAAVPADLPELPVIGPVDEAYRAMAGGDRATAAHTWRTLGNRYELSFIEADRPRPAPRRQPLLGLTPRESEVLKLVAEGKSNRQIAADLFISANTAGVHVSRILTKLGAATRTEAARRLFDATRAPAEERTDNATGMRH
ncbi:ATP-binding protein [Nonomuraea dietziae]|uniref:DNA-binding CsgD family transcriptional regulator n=1 Tax=Nonomuraea dietziae TaxID=65515 RepID=A0A7W5YQE8_9ACTN|nr:LuxR family transcriptional regulator [Nonomuraea dietziae]MBB3729517.1 DNA-binding CsgD family transcriptional regulator [Nonomuraea dietziae]